MQIDELLEKTMDDVDAHHRAMEAYRLLAAYVGKGLGPDFEFDIGKFGTFYGIDPHLVGLDRLGLETTVIMVGMRKPMSMVMAGAVMTFDDQPILGRFKRAIVIYALREFSEQAFRTVTHSTAFLSTFLHEFTHIRDASRTNNRIIGPAYDTQNDQSGYYNDPAEFNAYYHTFADNWLSILHHIRAQPQDAQDYAELYGITGDFNADVKNLFSGSSQARTFYKQLTDDRRKSLLRRLYRLYQEIMQIMQTKIAD